MRTFPARSMAIVAACAAVALGGACTGGGTGAGPQPETSAPEKAPEKTSSNPRDLRASRGSADGHEASAPSGPNWAIATLPQPPYRAGMQGRFDVRLEGRNGYHVNQEYPIELTIRPVDGVTLPKARFQRGDASAFEEAKAIFPVAFTASAPGRREIAGELNFSVCNPQNCLLERQPVTFAADVQ